MQALRLEEDGAAFAAADALVGQILAAGERVLGAGWMIPYPNA